MTGDAGAAARGDWLSVDPAPDHPAGRYAAVDVHYRRSGGAKAALVVARDVTFGDIEAERTSELAQVSPYRPGEFFLRELPAVRAVLAGVNRLDLLIVDGYVTLDPQGRPGLGAHAHVAFKVPVIGVAKTAFRAATHAIEVCRGAAARPPYVTAAGLAREEAAAIVRAMAGPYRLPDALRRVDALARGAPADLRRHQAEGRTWEGGTAEGGTAEGGTAEGGTAEGGTAEGGTADRK